MYQRGGTYDRIGRDSEDEEDDDDDDDDNDEEEDDDDEEEEDKEEDEARMQPAAPVAVADVGKRDRCRTTAAACLLQ